MNPGNEQNVAVGAGVAARYPDLVLTSLERSRRLEAVIEVETGESVNHLEALAEWAHFAKLPASFHLYVPSSMVDVARRLCEDNGIRVGEIWSFHGMGDEVRFTLVHRSRESPPRHTGLAHATGPAAKARSGKARVAKPTAKARVAKPTAPKPPKAKRPAANSTAKSRAGATRSQSQQRPALNRPGARTPPTKSPNKPSARSIQPAKLAKRR
jgi:hypothetical protein